MPWGLYKGEELACIFQKSEPKPFSLFSFFPSHNPVVLNITMPSTRVTWIQRFCMWICPVSFLCALGIFTESQIYAYTIGIHGTYAHLIYLAVGVTLFSAIHVLLIQPDCCKAFLNMYKGCFILKSCGGYLVMFTICFLSSGTGLHYLRLSSDGTSPKPAVAVPLAPYRSQAFAEIAGLLASVLLTVNALSIIFLLKPGEHNTIFEIAATLTLESAMELLYKYPYVTIAAAVFIFAMTLLKNWLHRYQARVGQADQAAVGQADQAAVDQADQAKVR